MFVTKINYTNKSWELEEIEVADNIGKTGELAIRELKRLINGIRNAKTEYDIFSHFYRIEGYAMCCKHCGFLEEDGDLMMEVDRLVGIELERVKGKRMKKHGEK